MCFVARIANPCRLILSQVVAIVPHQHGDALIDILCNYVFGLGPLAIAAVAQHFIVRKYVRRIRAIARKAEAAAAEGQTAAAAPNGCDDMQDDTKRLGEASKAGEKDTRRVADVQVVGEEQV